MPAGTCSTGEQKALLIGLVLASVVTNAGVAMLTGSGALRFMGLAISIAMFTLLFALVFKFLPDAEIAWQDVWVGAGLTALQFAAGNYAIGLYLGHSAVASSYGAAGSLVALLIWVYYSSVIVLFGAEVTQVYARRFGSGIRPA